MSANKRRTKMRKGLTILLIAAGLSAAMALTSLGCAGCGCSDAAKPAKTAAKEAAEEPAAKPQTLCPVMGGKINKEIYVDVQGYRVYACCAGCLPKIKAEPDKYVAKIQAKGEEPAVSPACEKCGELKGTDNCCKPADAKCGKCGMNKGSPKCCK